MSILLKSVLIEFLNLLGLKFNTEFVFEVNSLKVENGIFLC